MNCLLDLFPQAIPFGTFCGLRGGLVVFALQSSTMAVQSTDGFQFQKLWWATLSPSLVGHKGFSWLLRELGRGSWTKEKQLDQFWHWLPVSVKVTKPFQRKNVPPFRSEEWLTNYHLYKNGMSQVWSSAGMLSHNLIFGAAKPLKHDLDNEHFKQ